MGKNTFDAEQAIQKKITMLEARLRGFAARAEQDAKAAGSWQDQTGDARKGLRAAFEHDTEKGIMRITLAHTLWYGIFLEKAHGGPAKDKERRHDRRWWEQWANSEAARDFLESADNGKHALLNPILEAVMPDIKRMIQELFGDKTS